MSVARDLSKLPMQVAYFSTVEELRNYTGPAKSAVVTGYTGSSYLGTSAVYSRAPTSTAVHNGKSVVVGYDSRRWLRAEYKQPVDTYNPARFIQLVRTNSYLMNNYQQGIVVLGDSISHGAYAGSAYEHAYVYLLARAVNAEFGGTSIGEFPMEGLHPGYADPMLYTPQLADVTFSGSDWGARMADKPVPYNYPLGNFGPSAVHAVNGKTYSSSVNGATITLRFPTMGRLLSFKYTQQPGGGVFKISVNGSDVLTVDTAGSLDYNKNTDNVLVTDNGRGECVVVITKQDALPVEINALYNLKVNSVTGTDLGNRMQVHNYSQAGRALNYMSEDAIIRVCNSAALIMSLGFNDWNLGTDTDDTLFAAFKQRIDWLIQYCKVYDTLLVVQDFIWYESLNTSRTRRELRRLATECNGAYIPYADYFFAGGKQPVQSPPQLNDPLYLWADTAHPNRLGNELIFSTLTKTLGLSVSSKTLALQYHDWEFPLQFVPDSTVINYSALYPGSLTSIKQYGDQYHIRINVKPATGSTIPGFAIAKVCDTLPVKFRTKPLSLTHMVGVSSFHYGTGAAQTYGIVEQPQTVNVFSNISTDANCLTTIIVREIV